MAKFERVKDPWADLRKNCFNNVEPEISLYAITTPVSPLSTSSADVESLPALSASVSYGSTEKIKQDIARAKALNKKLITSDPPHKVPFESVQFNFHIKGISKACAAQLSRYRHTGHVSSSLRYRDGQDIGFIYPLLDYITDEHTVETRLYNLSRSYQNSLETYKHLRTDLIDDPEFGMDVYSIHKEDARSVLPVSYATERMWWCNALELRHIFNQRLRADAQWEIRRLAWMLYDFVIQMTPSLFEDIVKD